MSESQSLLLSETATGLGAVEKLIDLLKPLIGFAIPDFRACARGFEAICKKLLDANENVARWINRFRDFDVTHPNVVEEFRQLAADYRSLKTGRRYQELKFDCREIATIYDNQVEGKLREIFAGSKLEEARELFKQLGNADAALVQFVHMVIFERLDAICHDLETAIDTGDFEAAEVARLGFKIHANDLLARLQTIGTELADLVLEFKRLASQSARAT